MTETLDAPLCLPPRPLRNRNNLRLPALSCDSHFHVFAPDATLASPRSYTPWTAPISDWLALAESFGVARGVLVQPSVYGLDNHVLLAAMAQAPDCLRGVVVIPPETSDAELERLDALGVRGVRFNLRNKSGIGFDAFSALAPRIRTLGWHAQFQIGPEAIATVGALTARHDITGVIDHLAFIGPDTPGTPLDDLVRCLAGGRIYTKISAPYRLGDTPAHQFYRKALETLTVCYPDRLLWGSDWPHSELFETVPEDDDLIALSLDVVPTGSHDAIFAGNAQTLYFQH
ncbi:MAG: amidohydrolase family protein [Devosia sp.]|uniref:amidohydrolase family protein n=1 Tax=Devosia sp. TaxID=1871048 RepID=UPI0024C5DB95|nr:amidohydrolase family protein [Devosia sp.]UYN99365.1 MAG: amidohydrolase family protein [Devosia sp.]